MPWWTPTWPSFPTFDFALPSNLQRRFISFLLKRSLGPFLKPGQLDVEQIDSQLGSGYLQVKELEIDDNAVNTLLSGIPLDLREGSIGTVTARVPWPNPLSGNIRLSLSSLHLVLEVSARPSEQPSSPVDLAESVVSVAETFVHDEMSVYEEEELMNSIHEELGMSDDHVVPGGLDPFGSPEDRSQPSNPAGDPDGVSLFAGLLQRLLLRFEMDVEDLKITIVHPGHSEFIVSLAELHLNHQASGDPSNADSSLQSPIVPEDVRVIRLSGFSVQCRNLDLANDVRAPISNEQSPTQSNTASASDSDYDEASQLLMSQSFAALPPRPNNRLHQSLEVDSSALFQSAMSTLPEVPEPEPGSQSTESSQSNAPRSPTPSHSHVSEALPAADILCAMSTEPLVIRITLRIPTSTSASSMDTPPTAASPPTSLPPSRSVSVAASMGPFACAIRPWHLSAALELADAFSSSGANTASGSRSRAAASPSILAKTTSYLDEVDISVRVRAIVALALPSGYFHVRESSFFERPLQPPNLSSGYSRLYVDTITASFRGTTKPSASLSTPVSPAVGIRSQNDAVSPLRLHAQLAVADLSILAFGCPPSDVTEHRVLPVLITDPTLSGQYGEEHDAPPSLSEGLPLRRHAQDLPTISSPNWLSPSHRTIQARISHWRSRPTARNRYSHRSSVDTARAMPTSPQSISLSPPFASPSPGRDSIGRPAPAISVAFDSGEELDRASASSSHIIVDIALLRAFVDVEGFVQGDHAGEPSPLMAFVQDLSERRDRLLPPADDATSNPSGVEPPRSPVAHMGRVQTFEQHALDGLGLTMDYGLPAPREAPSTPEPESKPSVSVHAPFIRLEARASSNTHRSGAVLIDVHALSVDTSSPTETGLHFATDDAHTLARGDSHLVSVSWRRAVVAISPPGQELATAFVSIGPLMPDAMSRNRQAQLPRVSVGSSALGSTSIVVNIPSVHADLTKDSFDGLQLWADDVAKVMERASTTPPTSYVETASQGVRDPSLIGSRYFLQQKRGSQDSGRPSDRVQPRPKGGQTVIKVFVAEAFARLRLSREDADGHVKPLDILASDLDVLLEIKPDGKDETVCTMGIMNIAVLDQASASPLPILSLTAPRGYANTTRQFLHLRFKSSVVAGSSAKESQIAVTLSGFTYNFVPDLGWINALAKFVKPPAGVFEGVPPSEQTFVTAHVRDGSVRLFAPNHPGAFLMHVGELDFSTVLTSDNPSLTCEVSVPSLSALMADDFAAVTEQVAGKDLRAYRGAKYWLKSKYALIAEILNANVAVDRAVGPPAKLNATVDGIDVRVHLAADTGAALGAFFTDLASAFQTDEPAVAEARPPSSRAPEDVSVERRTDRSQELSYSVDEAAFRAAPEVGAAPDMIADDLPVNMDYLDESFGAAAGLREMTEEDMDDFDTTHTPEIDAYDPTIISQVGGETIRLLEPEGLEIVENHFNTLPAITEELPQTAEILDCVKLQNVNLALFLYDGYDLSSTRRTIEHEMKEMKKRLAKIRQLVAEGQKYDPTVDEEPSALLFNSFYVGLKEDAEGMEGDRLIGAIDEALMEGFEGEGDVETASQSSWQSLPAKPQQRRVSSQLPTAQTAKSSKGRRLTRATTPSVEFKVQGANIEHDRYADAEDLASRVFATIKELEIYDHCKTSTWRKFLSALRLDSRGNIRETGSSMVRVEVQNIRPVRGNETEEVRLRAKLLPLRLHVDQDALDFLKKFFSFKDPNAAPSNAAPAKEAYLQRAEVFPVGLKLDYKPRRVDYRALREGKTIELMNFFHFDGAEMTLRHITLYGVTGWPRFFDMLNDLWTPDVKATQLADVISGVAPIRSVVNVGSGVADLVLLPIAQYRKDGRLVRGVQKGTKAFVQSTAMEAVKLGARLATGTQVILEQAENVLGSTGAGQHFESGETLLIRDDEFDGEGGDSVGDLEDALREDPISRYAEQPQDLQEGMQAAYEGMKRNLNEAAQTILAVPMEVYERSGNEGAVRAVIRAVPIAVLRPMIGASEAVSKALLGLQNSMDPNVRLENEVKYKHRA